MKNRFLVCLFFISIAVFLSSGCRKDLDAEGLVIPRLMLEGRNVDYGSLQGKSLTLPVSGTTVAVSSTPLVNEFEIANVDLVKVDLGMALLITTTEKGGRDLYRASVTNMGSRIVFTVNGNAIGARRIDGAVKNGALYTFVEVEDGELDQLVLDIRETIRELAKQYKF